MDVTLPAAISLNGIIIQVKWQTTSVFMLFSLSAEWVLREPK